MKTEERVETMRNIFARFNFDRGSEFASNIQYQQFVQAWASVSGMTEIFKVRGDADSYFDGKSVTGGSYVEAFFTNEEAIVLKETFPKRFQILIYA